MNCIVSHKFGTSVFLHDGTRIFHCQNDSDTDLNVPLYNSFAIESKLSLDIGKSGNNNGELHEIERDWRVKFENSIESLLSLRAYSTDSNVVTNVDSTGNIVAILRPKVELGCVFSHKGERSSLLNADWGVRVKHFRMINRSTFTFEFLIDEKLKISISDDSYSMELV